MDMATERQGDMLLVRVAEQRLDAAIAIQFKEAMRALAADGPPRVVLDLGQVGFLDSSGLGAVVAVMKALGPGRHLELAALTPPVARVFRLTRMDTIFTIHSEASSLPMGNAPPPAQAAASPAEPGPDPAQPTAAAPGQISVAAVLDTDLTVAGDVAHGR
jgi:anti-sigma B factor antagonist